MSNSKEDKQKELELYRWVKASERLPEKCGEFNRVVVRGEGFVSYGYRNHISDKPEMIYEIGIQLFCNNNVEWLEKLPTPTPSTEK